MPCNDHTKYFLGAARLATPHKLMTGEHASTALGATGRVQVRYRVGQCAGTKLLAAVVLLTWKLLGAVPVLALSCPSIEVQGWAKVELKDG